MGVLMAIREMKTLVNAPTGVLMPRGCSILCSTSQISNTCLLKRSLFSRVGALMIIKDMTTLDIDIDTHIGDVMPRGGHSGGCKGHDNTSNTHIWCCNDGRAF